ncbi:uncharacterized protein N7479_008433 [Penicillium vulpinum]|nr:uncharacterized protein N7479_008433 [Penicillium vulpinum]KAJ5961283.1 hypothetical protein N7479_008433 [Penicillium vulpinum]
MAPKEPSTPKSKSKVTKPAKAKITKRTTGKVSPAKASSTKASPPDASPPNASPPDASPLNASLPRASSGTFSFAKAAAFERDLVFLWKCVKMSSGMKIDWAAVAKDAGKPTGTVQKQYWRLNAKMEKHTATTDHLDPNEEDNEQEDQTANDSE